MKNSNPEETPLEPSDDSRAENTDEFAEPKAELDDKSVASDGELVGASAKPIKRKTAKAPVRKNKPTPKRDQRQRQSLPEYERKATPKEFVSQSVGELRKVVWPTPDQLRQYFIVVLVFVLFIIAFVGILDVFFGWGLLQLLG